MKFANNIKTLCKEESLSISKFSALTGIGYSTMQRYSAGARTPTIDVIENKILSVERFKKYRSLLLGTKETTDKQLDPENPDHKQFLYLLEKIHEKGLETEALGILRVLAAQQGKDSPDAE